MRLALFQRSTRLRWKLSGGAWSARARASGRGRGRLLLDLGLPDAALPELRPAEVRGSALVCLGRHAEAAAELRGALARDPELWSARLWYGTALLRSGDKKGWRELERCAREEEDSYLPHLLAGLHGRKASLDAAVRVAPRAAWPRFIRGWSALQDDEPGGAVRDLDVAIGLDGESHWAHVLRAWARESLGDEEGARLDLNRAMSLSPHLGSSPDPWSARRAPTKDFRFIDNVLKKRSSCAWALAWRGELGFEALRPEEALRDLRRSVAADPGCGWARAFLARAEGLWLGRFEKAEAELTRALESDPACGWIAAWRGLVRAKAGRFREAASDYGRAIADTPHYALPYLWRAALPPGKGGKARTLADLDAAVELDPNYGPALERRRQLLWSLGEPRAAFADMAAAVRRESRFSWCGTDDTGAYRAAVKDLSALAAGPERVAALFWRGETHLKFGALAEAGADLGEVLRLEPEHAWALALRGDISRRLREPARALADLDRAVSLDPLYARAYAARALTLLESRTPHRAISDLDLTVALDFGAAWAYERRARLHLTAGRRQEALLDVRRALSLNRRSREARALLKKLGGSVSR